MIILSALHDDSQYVYSWLLVQQSKVTTFMGLRCQAHTCHSVPKAAPPRGCFRCQAEKLLNTCHSLASWTVVKNFPCLCNYFLWASQGLLHSWRVFRAGSSGFQNERGASPATGDCFLYTPGSRKELFSKGERTGIGQLGGNDCLIQVNRFSSCYKLWVHNSRSLEGCLLSSVCWRQLFLYSYKEKEPICSSSFSSFLKRKKYLYQIGKLRQYYTDWATVWKSHYQRISFRSISKVSWSKRQLHHEVTWNLIQARKQSQNSSRLQIPQQLQAQNEIKQGIKVENTRNISLFPYCFLTLDSLNINCLHCPQRTPKWNHLEFY